MGMDKETEHFRDAWERRVIELRSNRVGDRAETRD